MYARDTLVHAIIPMAEAIVRRGRIDILDLKPAGFKDPLMVIQMDAVGTKQKIAEDMGIYNTVGIDLVAMCVNKILEWGAEPLYFYENSRQLDMDAASQLLIFEGIAKGCEPAGCVPRSNYGGETSEMPGNVQTFLHSRNSRILIGTVIGAVEKEFVFPRIETICSGDIAVGIASSGIHSNSFTIVRKIGKDVNLTYQHQAPFNITNTLGEELLTTTKIYNKVLVSVVKSELVKAYMRISDGGLIKNIPNILPANLGVQLDASLWQIPPVFCWIAAAGEVPDADMLGTFNCGLGAILVVAPANAEKVNKKIISAGEQAWTIGTVVAVKDGDSRVVVTNLNFNLRKSFNRTSRHSSCSLLMNL